jgi:ribosome-associated toxin RatA of RatAB toxin-antitoxin module
MPSIARSALVNHSAAQMYSLVCDIESYSQFLPWCDGTTILEQSDTHQVASVTVDRRMKGISFTTRNTLSADTSIHMALVSGPFKSFGGIWTFKALGESACRVELSMDFEFQSRILGALLGPAFTKICDTMVAAFVKRASVVYSRGPLE